MARAPAVSCALVATLTFGSEAFALTVEEAVSAGCSTQQVEALSLQIIAQGNCIEPGAYVELPAKPNVNVGGAVLPFMEEPARDALVMALDANASTAMQINSMLRTVAQQYLLYRWYQLGNCGIGLAATPGNSNHETGLAIDIQQYNTWRPMLEAVGFEWLGSSDPVHFDYAGPGAVSHIGVDVLAFQQLWNKNNPQDTLTEDGDYGPQTETRLKQSPADGFPLGADCGRPMTGELSLTARFADADDRFNDGPSAGVFDLFVGSSYAVEIDLTNEGAPEVPDATLSVTLPDALSPRSYTLASDASGSFEPVDVPGNPPTDSLPNDFDLTVGTIAAGETRRVTLSVGAEHYSVDQADPLALAFTSGSLSVELEADVYSSVRWEWNGMRMEGWTSQNASVDASSQTGALAALGDGETLAIDSPTLSLAAADVLGVSLRMSRSGPEATPAALSFTTDAGSARHELDLPADAAMHEVSVDAADLPAGTVTGLTVIAFDGSVHAASASIDYLRIEAVAPTTTGEDASGCSCRVDEPRTPDRGVFAAFVALLLFVCRRGGMRARRRMLR